MSRAVQAFRWLTSRTYRERVRYRRAMVAAIAGAAKESSFVSSSRSDGLRAILMFEAANGIPFDPFSNYHCCLVYNKGWFFALKRALRRLETALARNGRERAA